MTAEKQERYVFFKSKLPSLDPLGIIIAKVFKIKTLMGMGFTDSRSSEGGDGGSRLVVSKSLRPGVAE
jgi:hypothetical protein